jgi:hypothetical protein
MVIYIHGFGGSGEGNKAEHFRKYFKTIDEDFIAPSLSYVPDLAIKTLEELIESYHEDVKLIGSSLGGFYTIYLAHKYNLQAVLINPSIFPYKTLSTMLGHAPNFYDESHYIWNLKHIEMLQNYEVKTPNESNFLLLLQKGDKLLDYKEAIEKFQDAKIVTEDGGSHSFDGIEKHFEYIRTFFAIGNQFKHTRKVKGVGFSNYELALRVGDLYYDDLALFLDALHKKLNEDALADENRGRKKLAQNLYNASNALKEASISIEKSWDICHSHTIAWLKVNGSNR